MRRFNIMAAKAYITKSGEQKTRWVKLGSIAMMDDGKMFGEIDAMPSGAWFDGSINLFEQDQQQRQGQQQPNQYQQRQQQAQPQVVYEQAPQGELPPF